jgi:putative oxygen-independent coproporphyrinogen III oxidase
MQSHTAPEPSPLSAPLLSREAPKSSAPSGAGADPLAIYIHWPFCQSKCPYCDFNSYARRTISEEQYLEAALSELDHYAAETRGRPISSIFFGGGTPSLMMPHTVGELLDKIAALWPVESACEVTLEANPSSVESDRFEGYRIAGVNRVSLGVQSLSDEQLRFLGRLHTAAEARQALEVAGRYFERISFDLIYARPGQTEFEWRLELREALALARRHLSLYQLTIEPETAFFDLYRRGKLSVPGADLSADLYTLTQEMCEAAGLPAYEVSNHAAPGQESRHNLIYWRYGDYLGIGPGAHGRLTAGARKYATAAEKAPAAWYAKVNECGSGCEEHFELHPRQQAEEAVLMGLRLREGLDLAALSAKTGFSPALQVIAPLEEEDLLRRDGDWLRATMQGRLVLNALVEAIAAGLEERASSLVLSDSRSES